MQLNPYLSFNGQCEEAFRFYERCLGGKILAMLTYKDTPMVEQTQENWQGKIAHARLQLGNYMLMGSDGMADRYEKPQGITVTLNIDDPAEAERVFHQLAEGGTTQMPIQGTFWAKRFGMTTDRFGTPWMVNCEKPMQAQRSAAQ
jgi:PhnB protein